MLRPARWCRALTRGSPLSDRVQFGGPFTGYVSSVLKHLVPPDKITGDSRNVFLNPFDGSWNAREGALIVGDTLTSNHEATGLLEQKMASRVRQLLEMDSLSMSDGMPVPSALLTTETNTGYLAGSGLDSGFFGTVYVRDIAGNVNYSLLQEFGNAYYPVSGAGAGMTSFNMKVVPLWYESGDGGYTRGAFQFARRFLTPGSRRMVDASSWRYFPNLRGTPSRWNRRLNNNSAGLTEPVRIFPTGAWPPLYPPVVGSPTASTGSDAVWADGDYFYASVMFQFEDGSFSMPFTPRAKNTRLASGLGAITVGTIGNTSKYRDVTWSKIPLGPDGTIARILLRSPKQNLATTSDIISVSTGNLQICGVLRNNTQTSFVDTLGTDTGLLDDVNIVRQDWILPRRARYIGTGDQRMIIGYSLPNPCAIMLAPTGSAATRDLNLIDTGAIVGGTEFLLRISSTQVELHKIIGAGAPSSTNFDYATYGTLQDMVDAINATTTASTGGEWAACLAPGVDGSLSTTYLCQSSTTSVSSTSAASNDLIINAATLASIPVGAKIYDSAGKIAAGVYVVAKTSTTHVTISSAASGPGSAAGLVFYSDVGDEANVTGGTHGYIRCFAPTLPGIIGFKNSSMVGYDRVEKSSIYFTVSSPGAATTGISLAANAWASANKRTAPGKIGAVMGITDIEGAAVVEYSRGRRLFVNQRGVTSGEDFDYRLLTINDRRGAISASSCVAVNNVAVCLTPQGLVATDKSRREVVLSNDIHNPTTTLGDLIYEITKCLNGVQADDDTGKFTAATLGSQLVICYRASGTNINRRHVYDFSLGVEASGLDELVNPKTGEAFGWSAPYTAGYSAMMQLSRDAGPVNYGWGELNLGSAGDGRLDQFERYGRLRQWNIHFHPDLLHATGAQAVHQMAGDARLVHVFQPERGLEPDDLSEAGPVGFYGPDARGDNRGLPGGDFGVSSKRTGERGVL